MWVISYIFGVLLALVDIVLVIVSLTVPDGAMWGTVAVVTLVVVGLFFSGGKARSKKKGAARSAAAPYMDEGALAMIPGGGLPVVQGTPVVLSAGEAAHYYAPAYNLITKKRVVGRTGGGAGVSVRVAKGVSLRTGGGSSQNVRSDVTDRFPGSVVLTNRRLVFLNNQAGFECSLSSISAMTPTGEGLLIQSGSKSYQLSVSRSDLFEVVLRNVIGNLVTA